MEGKKKKEEREEGREGGREENVARREKTYYGKLLQEHSTSFL